MNKDILELIKQQFKEQREYDVQQRSAHKSDMIKMVQDLEKKIDSLSKHPIFKAWDESKLTFKLIKWAGIAIIGLSTLIVAIKNGGSILKDVLNYILR